MATPTTQTNNIKRTHLSLKLEFKHLIDHLSSHRYDSEKAGLSNYAYYVEQARRSVAQAYDTLSNTAESKLNQVN